MNIEELKKKPRYDWTPLDIIESLERDYHNTITFITELYDLPYMDWGKVKESDKKRLVKVLVKNKYDMYPNEFNAICPAAYYVAYKNDGLPISFNRIKANEVNVWKDALYDLFDEEIRNTIDVLKGDLVNAFNYLLGKNIKDPGYFEKFQAEKMSNTSQMELYRGLINNGFKIKEYPEYDFLIKNRHSWAFLLSSLKNDYEGTIEYVNKHIPKQQYIDFMMDYRSYKQFKEVVQQENIDLSKLENSGISLINYQSVEEGKQRFTRREIYTNLSMFIDEEIDNFVKCLDSLQDKDLLEVYRLGVGDFIQAWHGDSFNNEEVSKRIINNTRNLLPISNYPFKNNKDVQRFLKEGRISKSDAESIYMMLDGGIDYNLKSEKKVLERLNYTPTPKTLEEAIISMENEDKTKFNLSFAEIHVLQLYCKKLLSRAGIKHSNVDMFSYASKVTTNGGYNNWISVSIRIYNNHDSDIKSIVRVINHEVNHAIQDLNVKGLKIDEDPDILYYAIDDVLREVIGEKYYENEYYRISSEFDADYKASMQAKLLFSDLDTIYEESIEDFNKMSEYNNIYDDDKNRTKEKVPLDEFFIKTLNDLAKEDSKKYKQAIKTINREYKIITYEYKFTPSGVEKKSIEEMELGAKSSDKKEAHIYQTLLENRMNKIKNDVIEHVETNKQEEINNIREAINVLKDKFKKRRHFFKQEIIDLKQRLEQGIANAPEINKNHIGR